MNQLEQIKQIAEDVASEYEMPSIASGVYLDFAVNVAKIYGNIQYSLAYQAGQEAERERFTKILQQSYISEESVICICNKEAERIINLINTKE